MTDRRVRRATPDDALAVRRLVDGALLEVGDVESRIDDGSVLVATEPRPRPGATGETRRILGAVVLEAPVRGETKGAHVAAIAVHRRHRGRGIGTDLLEAALERAGALTANFDADVRPFYESLGFDVESIAEGRYRGVKRGAGARTDG
ncbi:GNAT family N-acetyltransferase [Natronosalvus caseinilyticus]|uniref:GNAT family N-acetyltransferase n=1 Tax=Natronosalvus caseinilyticus TaxID=2953747 RepID=UPI0028A69A4B|nr:GNAT family N-acetyltransferase [Natronosalvus caseinilyticus]